MEKYKGSKHYIKDYLRLLEYLKLHNITLSSYYYNSNIKCDFIFRDVLVNVTPGHLKRTMNIYYDTKSLIESYNDTLLDVVDYGECGFVYYIETFDKALITMKGSFIKRFYQVRDIFFNKVRANRDTVLSPYYGAEEPITIKYKKCKDIHTTTPYLYRRDFGCPFCYGNSPKLGEVNFKERLKINGHKLLGKYKNNNTPVLIDTNCKKHGSCEVVPVEYKIGSGCPKCHYANPERAKEEFYELLAFNKHTALTPYIYAKEHVLIDFNCGHKPRLVTPDRYKAGCYCRYCTSSFGEKIIQDYLTDKNIDYDIQLKLDNGRLYDIYIPQYNLIVEVHGKQHYEEVERFKSSTLEERQAVDQFKEEYAKSLGYNYMVIDYRESKPALALKRFKKQFNEFLESYNLK